MRKLIAIAILVTWPTCFVWASVNASGTIGTGGTTFQLVFAANPTRTGCQIQNNTAAAHTMYVYAGPIANATLTNTMLLVAAQSTFNCTNGFGVQTDQISITGTAGDPFYANQW